jgi:PKHD-type hydroxylase
MSPTDFLKPTSSLRTNSNLVTPATAPRFLSPDECRMLISLSEGRPQRIGTVDLESDHKSVRDSQVRFLLPDNTTEWIFRRLHAALHQLNHSYQFHLSGFEPLQIATYNVGGHYGWHIDIGEGRLSTRKLSLVIQLTEPSEYEGGELEFMNMDQKASREIGTLIAFPSYLMHRVTPVTRGVRKSLASWIRGDAFR